MLTIIGLGPGDPDFLTMKAYQKLTSGQQILLRTHQHPVVPFLEEQGARFASYDWVYEEAADFDAVYETIAADLVEKARREPVIYAVPGNPFVAEKSVILALAEAKEAGIETAVVYGVSFIDAIVTALGADPVEGLSIVDAFTIADATLDPSRAHLVIQLYDDRIASRAKLALMDRFGDEHRVFLVRAAGIAGQEQIEEMPLYALDRRPEWIDHLTSLYVPAVVEKPRKDYGDLVRVMHKLRGPGGCPWDREQTHASLAPYLIEETYEVLDAIEKNDPEEMAEELGDLLLQVVFHATLAAEDGYFDELDVTDGIVTKLIARHPHVFAEETANTADEVLVHWEAIKRAEKAESHLHEAMARIPAGMPALMRAYKVQKKAAGVGFDWPGTAGVVDKIQEEIREVLEAAGDEERAEEVGDLLFTVVNFARHLGVRPELALQAATTKFVDRFAHMERLAEADGAGLEEISDQKREIYWEKSKKPRFKG